MHGNIQNVLFCDRSPRQFLFIPESCSIARSDAFVCPRPTPRSRVAETEGRVMFDFVRNRESQRCVSVRHSPSFPARGPFGFHLSCSSRRVGVSRLHGTLLPSSVGCPRLWSISFLLGCLLLHCRCSLHILDTSLFSSRYIANISSSSMTCLCSFFMASLLLFLIKKKKAQSSFLCCFHGTL